MFLLLFLKLQHSELSDIIDSFLKFKSVVTPIINRNLHPVIFKLTIDLNFKILYQATLTH